MEKPLLIYCPFPDAETALAVGQRLIEDKLAACINVYPEMSSVYSWQGSIERSREAVAIIKTRAGLKERAGHALKRLHPYETPAIIYLATDGAEEDTLAWLLKETGGD